MHIPCLQFHAGIPSIPFNFKLTNYPLIQLLYKFKAIQKVQHNNITVPSHIMQKLPEDTGLIGLVTDDDDSNYRQQICHIMQNLPEDTRLTGLVTDDGNSNYRQQIRDFVDWCDENYLHLNVGKTTGIIADITGNQREYNETEIKGETVEVGR